MVVLGFHRDAKPTAPLVSTRFFNVNFNLSLSSPMARRILRLEGAAYSPLLPTFV